MLPRVASGCMTSGRYLVIAVLVIGILVVPVAAMDMVVCFGADGHIALEAARNGRCGTSTWSPVASLSQPGVMLSNPDHCGPCVDMPLLTAETREHPLAVRTTPALCDGVLLACVASPVIASSDVIPTSCPSPAPLGYSPILTALRTIILLI
jgi:hypothetical protein